MSEPTEVLELATDPISETAEREEGQASSAPIAAETLRAPELGIMQRRVFPVKIRESSDHKRITVTINTDSFDRHRTIIEPSGAMLDNYQRNPIVLINHWYDVVAGRSAVSLRNGELVATMEEDDWDDDDPEIARWHNKVRKGFLRAASIGFIPIEYREEKDEARGRYYRITKWELLEWSWVSVPSNPDAIAAGRSTDSRLYEELAELKSLVSKLATPTILPVETLDTEAVPAAPEGSALDAATGDTTRAADDAAPDVPDEVTALPDEPDHAARQTPPEPPATPRQATAEEYMAILERFDARLDTLINRKLGRA